MEPMRLSYSAIKHWRHCQMYFYYAHVEKITRKSGASLGQNKGKIIHELIEVYHKEGDLKAVVEKYRKQQEDLFEEELEELGDIVGDCVKIFKRYINYYKDDNLQFPKDLIEYKIETPLYGDRVLFVAKIDALPLDPNDSYWIMDHKCHARLPDEKKRAVDIQLPLYSHFLKAVGFEGKIEGVIWDYIRTKIPSEPKVLNSGGLSKNKRIDTDERTYKRAIIKQGLRVNDYQDMLQYLRSKGNHFFLRVRRPLPGNEFFKLMLSDLLTSIEEIIHAKKYVRNLGYACRDCQFFELCQNEINGCNTDMIKELRYERKKRDGKDRRQDKTD